MNTYNPVVSESKLHCNSNVSVLLGGPIVPYVTKYSSKGTQEEDRYGMEAMNRYVTKRLTEEVSNTSKGEALSRVIGAALASNSALIVAPPMAKFLINNRSCFAMSHTIVNISVKKLYESIENGMSLAVLRSIGSNSKNMFVEAYELHYVLRPKELEHCSLLDFRMSYEVKYTGTSDQREANSADGSFEKLNFLPEHPGFSYQCVMCRENTEHLIPRIIPYEFPDTSEFGGSILDKTVHIVDAMENYAKIVLTLLLPFRDLSDLQKDGSYVLKFRSCYTKHIKPRAYLLKNIQEYKNSCKHERMQDDLEQCTEPFKGGDCKERNKSDDDDDHEDNASEFLNTLFNAMNSNWDMTDSCRKDNDEQKFEQIPKNMDCEIVRGRGGNNCGYDHLTVYELESNSNHFVEIALDDQNNECRASQDDIIGNNRETANINILLNLLVTETTRK